MTAQFQTVFLCLYVADPATFPSTVFLGTISPSENNLFIQLWKKNKKNSEFVLLPH